MKKFMLVLVVIMMVTCGISTAMANYDWIWNDVYDYWKDLHEDEYQLFLNTTYDSNGFVKDGVAYYASCNCSLCYDEYHEAWEYQEELENKCKEVGLKNYSCSVNVIGKDSTGRYVMEITIYTTTDMTTIPECYMEFEEPIYGCKMIGYDRIYVPND